MNEQEREVLKALSEYDKYISIVTDDTFCIFCGGPVDWRLHTADITFFHRDTCPVTKAREIVEARKHD